MAPLPAMVKAIEQTPVTSRTRDRGVTRTVHECGCEISRHNNATHLLMCRYHNGYNDGYRDSTNDRYWNEPNR